MRAEGVSPLLCRKQHWTVLRPVVWGCQGRARAQVDSPGVDCVPNNSPHLLLTAQERL